MSSQSQVSFSLLSSSLKPTSPTPLLPPLALLRLPGPPLVRPPTVSQPPPPPSHTRALRLLRTACLPYQLYLPLPDRRCLACLARGFSDPALHFVRDCPVFYEVRGRFPCLFPADGPGFSLATFLVFEDQACVASCVHQLLSLYYAYPRDPGLQLRLGSPHLPRAPPHSSPTPPYHRPPEARPRDPPLPDSTVIPDFIALAWRAGSTTLEGLPRARPQCTLRVLPDGSRLIPALRASGLVRCIIIIHSGLGRGPCFRFVLRGLVF